MRILLFTLLFYMSISHLNAFGASCEHRIIESTQYPLKHMIQMGMNPYDQKITTTILFYKAEKPVPLIQVEILGDMGFETQHFWLKQDGIGIIISSNGAPHRAMAIGLRDVTILGGTRYTYKNKELEHVNSATYEKLDGLALENKYLDLELKQGRGKKIKKTSS